MTVQTIPDSLAEAVRTGELETGSVFQCRVGNYDVKFRIEDKRPVSDAPLPAPLVESDIMIDPWEEFPLAKSASTLTAEPGSEFLPDPLEIPED